MRMRFAALMIAAHAAASGQTATDVDAGQVTSPVLGSVPAIRYPLEARLQKQDGYLVLRVLVDAKGWTQEIAIKVPSENPAFNEAALATAKHWRYTPGTRDGKPTAMWVSIPIRFSASKQP